MISFSYLPIKAVKPTKYEENCFFNRGCMFRIFFHFTDIHSILFVLNETKRSVLDTPELLTLYT